MDTVAENMNTILLGREKYYTSKVKELHIFSTINVSSEIILSI
jgi:hypothetical protein